MQKSKKSVKLLSLFLVVLFLFSSFSIAGSAVDIVEVTEGNCTYRIKDGKASLYACVETTKGKVEIPSDVMGNPIKKIDDNAFFGCTLVTSVTIPSTVESIGKYAFAFCTSLTSVVIPASVTIIGNNAFQNSNKVTVSCDAGSYAEKYATANGIPVKLIEQNIEIKVKNNKGELVSGATVEVYDREGTRIKASTTNSKGICTFDKSSITNADSITAYKDVIQKKGGSNRAAARAKYDNVIYTIRLTSDWITSTGHWFRKAFRTSVSSATLQMNSPKIILNCSVSYYKDSKTGDYYSDIKRAFEYVNQYLQNSTDGYMELGRVSIFSTTDPNSFYNKKNISAKCDIQVRQYESSDEWGSDVWPNSHVDGAFSDSWSIIDKEYKRIQMQKIAAGADITNQTQTWAKIVTHELGHYLFGFYDEYLNYKWEQWTDSGMRRPKGAPPNYGLMEYQYTDLEMSVPQDYKAITSESNRFIPEQYYRHNMSCWECFNDKLFEPNGFRVSLPDSDREFEKITNTVTFYDCRSNPKARALSVAKTTDKANLLFVMVSCKEGNLFLKTDDEIVKCTLSDFSNESVESVTLKKVTGGYLASLADFDESKGLLTVESETSVNTFDLYNNLLLSEDSFSNRNNSIIIHSDSDKDCSVIIYNNSTTIKDGSIGRIVSLNMNPENSLTLVGRAGFDGKLDYSTLSWYRYESGNWIKIKSETSVGEYSSLETKCMVTKNGIYALVAAEKAAETPSIPSGLSFFTAKPFEAKDGGLKININYINEDVLGYKVLYQAKDKTESATIITQNTELILKAENPNQEYDVTIWAILNSGAEVELGETQTVVSGEYYQEGSQIPFWWVVKYDLQEYDNEIVDDKDTDGDGYTNLQEYRNGTNPTVSDEAPPTGKVKSVSINNLLLNYKASTVLKPDITADDGVEYIVSYKSANPNVVSVDDSGNIKALKKGNTTITVSVTDQNGNVVENTCKVTVQYTVFQWIIKILLFGWIWY